MRQSVLTERFRYDLNCNIIEKRTPFSVIKYSYDAENRLLSWGKSCSAEYDSNGNLVAERTACSEISYTYTPFDRIESVTVRDFSENDFFEQHNTYDALCRRFSWTASDEGKSVNSFIGLSVSLFETQKTSADYPMPASATKTRSRSTIGEQENSLRYVFIGDSGRKKTAKSAQFTDARISPVYDGSGKLRSYYAFGSYGAEGKRVVFTDEAGSVRAELEPSRLVTSYAYTAFGESVGRAGHFGFIGKPCSVRSGLADFGYRDYKSRHARFSSQDPAHASLNFYSYCDGNPIHFYDTDGLYPVAVKEQYMQDMGHTLLGNSDSEYTDLEGCVVTAVAEALTALTGVPVTNDYVNSQKDCFNTTGAKGCIVWGNLETVFGLRDKNEFMNDKSKNDVLALRNSYNKYQETVKAIEESFVKIGAVSKIAKAQEEAAAALAHVDKITNTLARLSNEKSPTVVIAQVGYGKSSGGSAYLHYVPISTKIETVRNQKVIAITPTSRSDKASAVPSNSYRPNVGWFVENNKVYVPVTLINRIESFTKSR